MLLLTPLFPMPPLSPPYLGVQLQCHFFFIVSLPILFKCRNIFLHINNVVLGIHNFSKFYVFNILLSSFPCCPSPKLISLAIIYLIGVYQMPRSLHHICILDELIVKYIVGISEFITSLSIIVCMCFRLHLIKLYLFLFVFWNYSFLVSEFHFAM